MLQQAWRYNLHATGDLYFVDNCKLCQLISRSIQRRCSAKKKTALKNFAMFTGKELCWNLFFVNMANFLRTSVLKNDCLCIFKEPKQINFEKAIQTGNDNFIEKISNDRGFHKNQCSEWKCHVIPFVHLQSVKLPNSNLKILLIY